MVNKCPEYWWTNVLFISNLYPWANTFVDAETICLPWFWYISNEVQFFFLGLGLILLYRRWPKIGMTALWGLSFIGILACFLIAYFDKTVVSLP